MARLSTDNDLVRDDRMTVSINLGFLYGGSSNV